MDMRRLLNLVITVICAVVLLGTTIWLALKWGAIPDRLPTNYDFNGEITDYGSKTGLIPLHLLNWGMFILFTWMSLRPVEKGGAVTFTKLRGISIGKASRVSITDRAFQNNPVAANNIAIDMIMGMKLVLTLLLSYLLIQSTFVTPMAVWVIPAAMILIFIPIMIHLIRFIRLAG